MPEHDPVVRRVHAVALEQVGATGGLALERGEVVRDGERLVRRRVPDVGVDAVEDAEVAVALRAQRAVEAHPELGRQRLAGVPG